MYDVADKVFLVTGAAGGIGAEIVRIILDEGAKHVAGLDIKEEAGKALENELNIKHGANKMKFIKCDITKDLDAAYEDVTNSFGYIDCVVNNAALLKEGPEWYEKSISVNLTSLISSSLKAYNLMRKDHGGKGGTIINISSIAALELEPFFPIYTAIKTAIVAFDLCLGVPQRFEQTGSRVITLCFGCTATTLIKKDNFQMIDKESYSLISKQMSKTYVQKPQSAAKGLLDVYKTAENGSVWLSTHDRPAVDITDTIKEAHQHTSKLVYL